MRFQYMLAPLEDTTDSAFRNLCFRHGADLTFTEMTRLAGIVRNNKSTGRKIDILGSASTQVQFAAQKEDDLKIFLKNFKPTEAFAGINFNLGCPSPHLVRHGLGCALMKRLSKVNRLVGMVKSEGYSCSIKLRLGLNSFEKSRKVYLNVIRDVDADFFIVHARHGSEHYEAPADYSVYPECVATGKVIIANGDIDSKEKADFLKSVGLSGVMIGRAAVRNPAIFEQMKGLKETGLDKLKEEYLTLVNQYATSIRHQQNILKRLGTNSTESYGQKIMG